MSKPGAQVAIADLNLEGAAKRPRSWAIEKTAIGIAMDVASEEQVNAGVEQGRRNLRRGSTSSCRNAGIQIVYPIEDFPFADWKKLLAIHLDGAFLTTKALRQAHVQAGLGRAHLHGLGALARRPRR